MEIYVFLERSAMPTPAQWQTAITAAGFAVSLDTDFDPFTFTGFLPCQLNGHASGFEYYLHPKDQIAEEFTYLAPRVKPFDSVVTFVWGSSMEEMACVIMAASALAASTPSLLYAPEDDSAVEGASALGYAKEQLLAAAPYLKH
ncbi:hypothetical protein SAMN05421819_4060 [Bryocella elongata]|uniref:Uncharacterized protein n=2 Tax=Bryocella elongata TaxID=863522 RepID=A0A1H6BYD7_9BACT|nr:hypothetical protein SAMN05421819_4060 [Bryocella elongata]